MPKIIYFDIAAFFISSIIFLSLIGRSMTKGFTNRVFFSFVGVTILCIICDICAEYLPYVLNIKQSDFFPKIAQYGYFVTRNVSPALYLLLTLSIIGIFSNVRKRFIHYLFIFIPFFVMLLMIILNPFLNVVFYYDAEGVYHRGSLLWILYVINLFYIMLGICLLIKYTKILEFEKILPVIITVGFNGIAVLIQLFFPNLLIELFATSLAILVMTVTLLKTEEIIDPILRIQTKHEFFNLCKKYYNVNIDFDVILVTAKNCKNILTIFGENEFVTYQKILVYTIDNFLEKNKLNDDLFKISSGTFAILAPHCEKKSLELAKKIEQALERINYSKGRNIEISYKLFVFSCPKDAKNLNELQSYVQVFKKGYFAYDSSILYLPEIKNRRDFDLRINLNDICNRSLENKTFKMYYQPIFSFKENKFVSAEALMRLHDDVFGEISPELFIEEAEKNGSIHKLGDYMLEESFKFMATYNLQELGLHYLELNLSAIQCIEPDIVQKISDLSKKYNVPPSQVNLEITESANAWNSSLFTKNITNLAALGYEISLDDYGKGYSTIERSLNLPISLIKLDKSFVDNMQKESIWVAIKDTIHTMKTIGKKVLIEGIETEDCAMKFKELGCDFVQGYYYSKPLSKKDFIQFIKKHNAN